jgi:hypothetical protein
MAPRTLPTFFLLLGSNVFDVRSNPAGCKTHRISRLRKFFYGSPTNTARLEGEYEMRDSGDQTTQPMAGAIALMLIKVG